MDSELSYTIFKTAQGWAGVLGSAAGIKAVALPESTEKAARASLGNSDGAKPATGLFNDTVKRLKDYFNGEKTDFPEKLDYSGYTTFQQAVWETARKIPYGQTLSYGELAQKMGKPNAARAVGQAMGRNPYPIIVPCHRVVAGDGGLGGFAGGLKLKKLLLDLEQS